jgi:hypothetical protein
MLDNELIIEGFVALVKDLKRKQEDANYQMSTDKDIFMLLTKLIELTTPRTAAIEVIEHLIRTSKHNYGHQAITEVRDWYNNSPEWT